MDNTLSCLLPPFLLNGVKTHSTGTERFLSPGGELGGAGISSVQGCRWEPVGSGGAGSARAVPAAGLCWGTATPPSSSRVPASGSAVCVPPPSRITSSEKYQTSVAKKRVLTYFGHLFIFRLLLSVSVKKLL